MKFIPKTGREAGRFTLLETLGTGVAAVDLDHDGDVDLLFAGGGDIDAKSGEPTGNPPGLFLNDGTGHFTPAADRLVADEWPYSHGWAVADHDRDGNVDAALLGFEGTVLLRNDARQQLVNVSAPASIHSRTWDTSGVFVDANHDGWMDLYVAAYVDFNPRTSTPCVRGTPPVTDICGPQRFAPQRDHLWLNNGDGTFTDASEIAGLPDSGRGLGVMTADFNEDGLADVYVANDGDPNQLFLGSDQFPWTDSAIAAGVANNEAGAAEGSMGLAWDDFDGNGHADLFVTNFELEDNSLYSGLGNGVFRHATMSSGLAGQGRMDVRFGTGSIDFNHDQWPDLFALSGHVVYHSPRSPFRQKPALYLNESGRRFRTVTDQGGDYFRDVHGGRGCAVADLNGDGSQDLIVVDLSDAVQILASAQPPQAWVNLALETRGGDSDGVGATVTISTQQRQIHWSPQRGAGFMSHSPCEWHGALPENEVVRATVSWPSRRVEEFPDLAANRRHLLREGTGHALPPAVER
ncbi:MAG TPA: CRTAC1 family protein [Planctomycetaceae bacterium]|nr:CRTAC1 family protein [Planctomycetaceae bacterium]